MMASRSFNRSATISRSVPATAQRVYDRILCSIFESKNKVDIKVGLCFLNLATGEVTLSTILDTQTYVRTIHKIHIFGPSEILVPHEYLNPIPNKLSMILQSNVPNELKFVGLEKKKFSSTEGMDIVEKFAIEKDLTYLKEELRDKYHAMCALAAVVKYIRNSNSMNRVQFKKFRFKYEVPESTMFIDTRTIKSLQLTENSVDRNGLSFMKFLNSTLTKMGERALKNNILQPLTDKDSIMLRLLSVNELIEDESLLDGLRYDLKELQDLDKLFAVLLMCQNSNKVEGSAQRINQIILIKQAVSAAISIGNSLEDTKCFLLKQIRDLCKDETIMNVKNLIDEYINEDCYWASGSLDLKNQRIYAVKAGRNGFLDVSRQIYKFVIDEVLEITEKLSVSHSLTVEQSYNSRRGFYLKIRDYESLENIPDVFINRQERKNFLECTTLDIIKCNSRLDDTVSEILILSDQVIEDLIDEVTQHIPTLFMMSESLAILDLIQCFATNAIKKKYVCPEISDMLTLKASRHPVVESLIKGFVPNDVCAIKDTSRVQVITGTNMSGKSVYLKQVALLSIMAQIGSFVPADYAMVPLFDCLKARICADNFASTTSSFATEMTEMVCILEDIDKNSLVIIDELGRGSSLNDGFSISLAICEHLVSTGATIFISTHFHKLSKILGSKPGVIQNHMSSRMLDDGLQMNYKMRSGLTDKNRYGISFSKKFFSPEIINRAYELSEKLENNSIKNNPVDLEQMNKDRKVQNLVKLLKHVKDSEELTIELLLEIQTEFLRSTG